VSAVDSTRRKLRILTGLAVAVVVILGVGATAIRNTPMTGWAGPIAAFALVGSAFLASAVIGLVALVVRRRGE
jgi:hypothetical protein